MAARLKTFDYVVANPPFSDKRWSTGIVSNEDPYERFKPFGTPPAKQGDYAYLLHIVRSLKSTGKGTCILPHGVLFRGNAEADIRRALVRKGYIKGIIGLPANLFYGTGIPACIVVIDKEHAHTRKGIFMIDASQGFMKDGAKNRLREQDVHKIVDAFNKQLDIAKYSRIVGVEEIEKNEFNLNLPRYIDSQQAEDVQDIEGHLKGGILLPDVDALQPYWDICPHLRATLFKPNRKGYVDLAVDKSAIKATIYQHPEFVAFTTSMNAHFGIWRNHHAQTLRSLKVGFHAKKVIQILSEDLLGHYRGKPLMDAYAVYQHAMDYWDATMQDDCYQIAAEGWKAEPTRLIEKDKKGKEKDKGWTCDLVPKALLVARYFASEQANIDALAAELEATTARLAELEEEHGDEEGAFAELESVNKANVAARLEEIDLEEAKATGKAKSAKRGKAVLKVAEASARYLVKAAEAPDSETAAEAEALRAWLALNAGEADLKRRIKMAEAELDAACYAKYPKLSEEDIKTLVVDDKWLAVLDADIQGEMDRITQALTQRVKELAERYETTTPTLVSRVSAFEEKVKQHLECMGFSWN